MLDVHVPHPTHTWKDFFLHVGTICVGLLIAVSLEQTVEYFHHNHQRHELEEQLRTESELNKMTREMSLAAYDARLKLLLAIRMDVDKMLATHGKADLPLRVLTYPPRGHGLPGAGPLPPAGPAYDSAKADGRIALLSHESTLRYDVVNLEIAQFTQDDLAYSEAADRRAAFAQQFADPQSLAKPELSRMTEAQLMEYRGLLMAEIGKLLNQRTHAVIMIGTLNHAISTSEHIKPGVEAVASWLGATIDAEAAYPVDLKKMAQEIAADDAARDKSTK